INSSRAIRERLWKRVQEHAGPPPKGMKRPATQWVKPGIIGRVKHLRGEEDLRPRFIAGFQRGMSKRGSDFLFTIGYRTICPTIRSLTTFC
ncbi:hypothetical protein ACWKT6_35110, partial [Mesorhizobium sp. 14Arga]